MRLIDADLERSRIGIVLKENGRGANDKLFSANDIIKLLNNAPTFINEEKNNKVTVVEFATEELCETWYECNVCGCYEILGTFNYCPRCGKEIDW